MRLKFKTAFRAYIFLMALLLGWSLWTSAQETRATNSVSRTNEVSLGNDTAARVSITAEKKEPSLTFGLDQIAILKREVPKGYPLWQYVASLIYIFLAFAVSKLLDFLTRVYLKKWAEKTKTRLDDVLVILLNGPVKIVAFVILLHIGLQVYNWPDWIEKFLGKGLFVVVACSLTYMAMKFLDFSMSFWKRRATEETDRIFDAQLYPVINKSLKVFIVVVAVLLTSSNLGLNITSVLASLSIGGLALGLAAQDTLANLFGAISVFLDKPFRIGDRVQLETVDGTVESIGLRSTRVRNLDGHLITIPNKTMGNAIITNVTRRPNIKTVMNLGVTYDTSMEKLKRAVLILEEIYKAHPKTADLIVSFDRFGDFALNIKVVHWWNSTDPKEYSAGMQELNFTVKQRFDQEGINFAFPTQTLYMKQDSDWRINSGSLNEPKRLGA